MWWAKCFTTGDTTKDIMAAYWIELNSNVVDTRNFATSNQSFNEISNLMAAAHSFCPSWNFVEHNKVFRRENAVSTETSDRGKKQKEREKNYEQNACAMIASFMRSIE